MLIKVRIFSASCVDVSFYQSIAIDRIPFSFTDTLNLYLLDVVSGAMIFSITHKRVRGPIHIVHSENWLVYSYFNEKGRRTEIATLELYEGKIQSNTTGK